MPLVDLDAQPQLITLACRFIPYDQWLTTHIDPSWKVKQVKLWILSKCLGLSLEFSQPASVSRTGASVGGSSSTHHSHIATGASTNPSAQRYRPASPITFAPDPRRRPISPIMFAKSAKGGKARKQKVKSKTSDGDLASSEGGGGSGTGTGTGTPSASSPSVGDEEEEPAEKEGDDDEDEDWNTADESPAEKELPPPPSSPPLLPPVVGNPPQVPAPTSIKCTKYNTTPMTYTLLRFSTGQILEDDLSLAWYELAPYELIELHAHRDVWIVPTTWYTPPPNTSSSLNTMGGLPALTALSPLSEHGHGYGSSHHSHQHHNQHHRTTSLYSLALPATSVSSPISASEAGMAASAIGGGGPGIGPHAAPSSSINDPNYPHPKHALLPRLNRTTLPTYIQPYWEGHIRALHVTRRPLAFDVPLANFANGYGYGYGGNPGTAGFYHVDPVAVALGIGQPPPMPMSMAGPGGAGYIGPRGEYVGGQVVPGGGVGLAMANMNIGGGSSEHSSFGSGGLGAVGQLRTILEWRLRWVIVQDGELRLYKTRESEDPISTIQLTSLAALRDIEHLAKSPYVAQDESNAPNILYPQPPQYGRYPPSVMSSSKASASKDTRSTTYHTPPSHTNSTLYAPSKYSSSNYLSGSGTESDWDSEVDAASTAADPAHQMRSDVHHHRRHRHRHQNQDQNHNHHSPLRRSGGERGSRELGYIQHQHGDGANAFEPDGGETKIPKVIGGAPTDDLRVICLKYKKAPKPVDASNATKSKTKDSGKRKTKEKEKEKEKEKKEKEKEKAKEGKIKKEKTKSKGRGLLSWERDDNKESSKSKEKAKGKGKDGSRGWMTALGVKRDRDGKDRSGKTKEKDKDKARNAVPLGPGVSDDVKERSAATAPNNPTKEQAVTRVMLHLERERTALSEADAEASITFAKRYDGEGDVTSSEDEVQLRMMYGQAVHNDEVGVAVTSGPDDDGEDDMVVGKVDKGKGKAVDVSEDGDEESPAEQAIDPDAEADLDIDPGADDDTDTDSDSPITRHQPHSASSHAHPESELIGILMSDPDAGAASSETFSSPVFAHSDGRADADGSEGDLSDVSAAGKGVRAHRAEYRSGYRFYGAEVARGGRKSTEAGPDPGLEQESIHEEEDRLEKERANLERRREKERARKKAEEQEKEKEKLDTLVLDMGSDVAFTSFLRVLHWYLPPMASSFVPSVPIFTSRTPNSTPTPTPTPFPSPTSPKATDTSPEWFLRTGAEGESLDDTDDIRSPSSPMRFSSSGHTSQDYESISPSSTSSQSDPSHDSPPEQNGQPTDMNTHSAAITSTALGVLPYPEWRSEVAARAQRAGLGDIGRALKWVIWRNGKQLELDLHEVRNRHAGGEETSAIIRKKRRDTINIQNRRRSTTSHASTITEGNRRKTALQSTSELEPLDASSSDASDDTGRLTGLTDSDSEENSEVEWQGWMADLYRQHQVRKQLEWQEKQQNKPATTVVPPQPSRQMGNVIEIFESVEPPKDAEEDRLFVRDRRRKLEPSGVVTVAPLKGTVAAISAPSALVSQSSSESLSRRLRGMKTSPGNRSSSPAGASSHGHSHPQTTSPSLDQVARKLLTSTNHSSLSHSTSMYSTGLRSGAAAELYMRRPSMPIIATGRIAGKGPTDASISLDTSDLSSQNQPRVPTYSPPFSPGSPSRLGTDDGLAVLSDQVPTTSSAPSTMPRRASSAGIVGTGGSLGRSTSILARGGLLRKDGITKESDGVKEKEKRVKEKEEKNPEREGKEPRKLQRPKLSLATSSTHQLVPQPATSQARSPSRSESRQSIMRRVKSGSSLNVASVMEQARSMSPLQKANGTPQPTKKKRKVLVNRHRWLDTAMDFAEGK